MFTRHDRYTEKPGHQFALTADFAAAAANLASYDALLIPGKNFVALYQYALICLLL